MAQYSSDWDEAMGIQHPDAYATATRARIIANAFKTWKKNTPRSSEIIDLLERKGKYLAEGHGYHSLPEVRYTEGFFGSLAKALDGYGKLTEKQIEAVLKCVDRDNERKAEFDAKREAQKSLSSHVGEVGKRQVFTLTCDHVVELPSDYGLLCINLLRDEDGNRIIYKGGKHLLNKGETAQFKATVKEHSERNGEKQTVVSRPALVE